MGLPPQQNLQIEQEIEAKNVLTYVSRTLKKIYPKEIIIIMVGTEDPGETGLLLANCYQITIPTSSKNRR
jgi:hypothetical protein